jgi:iron complex outermembrane recepter protein
LFDALSKYLIFFLNFRKMQKLALSLFIIFHFSSAALAQYRLIGQVLDEQNQPLSNAHISIDGSLQTVLSNADGNFNFQSLPVAKYTISISYVGYLTKKEVIELTQDYSVTIKLQRNPYVTDEVTIYALRASENSGIAQETFDKKALEKSNVAQDIPYMLQYSASAYTTSDAGSGIGYTSLRIRGVDATRTNVTINGVPLNDAESQGVYWVDLPDLASSVESIQIQRGVGSSTNGAGAFGASINIQSNAIQTEPYLKINSTYGSFNTLRNTISAGTGLIKKKFTADIRLSKINSDGYIRKAYSDLKSFSFSGAYYGKNNSLKINIFSGREKTYQAWYGVPENELKKGNRQYNVLTYDDETDNYQQDHFQMLYTHNLSSKWYFNATIHYTKGRGYYEQYRSNDSFADYQLPNIKIGDTTITNSDLIRRLWLDNDFYGVLFAVNYEGQRLKLSIGGGSHFYRGGHYGEIIWAQYALNSNIRQRYYDNDAFKGDYNLYAKVNYLLSDKTNLFVDLQYRKVQYQFLGKANDQYGIRDVRQSVDLDFFNPKIGVNIQLTQQQALYGFVGLAHKEPNRSDYIQSSIQSRPEAEQLIDMEGGYRYQSAKWKFQMNLYWMQYQNQLVLTGQVNDVGAFNRSNISNSYRAGIELESQWEILPNLTWNTNLTLSRNKVLNFKEYVSDYDQNTQLLNQYSETSISFSPDIIGSSTLIVKAFNNFNIDILSKYVGTQFLDNTENQSRKLNAYFVQDIRLRYGIKSNWFEELNLIVQINNVFNKLYESNGYTFSFIQNQQLQTQNFYYPQAGTNYFVSVQWKF